LRKATLDLQVFPVLCGSAFKNKGVQRLLDAVVDYLPSPVDVGPVSGIHPKTEKTEERKPDTNEPFAALAFKIMNDPYVGKLTFFRVYSGMLRAGTMVLNATSGKRERVSRLLLMSANKREDIEEVAAGDIAATVALREVRTGDTLCVENKPILLERIEFPTPVIEISIEPKSKADQDKISEALARLADEDPTFRVGFNEDTGQTIISGMGELHLEIIVDRLLREFRVDAVVGRPQVSYKECIRRPAHQNTKFAKQTGGRGQYAHVVIDIAPAPAGSGLVFENKMVGGAIPKEYVPSVQRGLEDAMKTGVLAGYPLVDIKVTLEDGSFHEVDSSDVAFRAAAAMALREAVRNADPALMEPIMKVEVVTPDAYLGAVAGDLNSRRGRILGIHPRSDGQVVSVEVPLSEMFGYATTLRSLTQGRAIFTMMFHHFKEVPESVSEKILERR
jgi:elongation factor G